MNARTLRNRLDQLVGESEAAELLETPNFTLGGKSPQDLIDAGDLAPVKVMLVNMEARERSRMDFITPPPRRVFDEIDELAADPIRDRLPAARKGSEVDRVLRILDGIEEGRGI